MARELKRKHQSPSRDKTYVAVCGLSVQCLELKPSASWLAPADVLLSDFMVSALSGTVGVKLLKLRITVTSRPDFDGLRHVKSFEVDVKANGTSQLRAKYEALAGDVVTAELAADDKFELCLVSFVVAMEKKNEGVQLSTGEGAALGFEAILTDTSGRGSAGERSEPEADEAGALHE